MLHNFLANWNKSKILLLNFQVNWQFLTFDKDFVQDQNDTFEGLEQSVEWFCAEKNRQIQHYIL